MKRKDQIILAVPALALVLTLAGGTALPGSGPNVPGAVPPIPELPPVEEEIPETGEEEGICPLSDLDEPVNLQKI